MNKLAITLPAAALLAYALLTTPVPTPAMANPPPPTATSTPRPVATPDESTYTRCEGQYLTTRRQPFGVIIFQVLSPSCGYFPPLPPAPTPQPQPSNWIVTQTCEGTIQHNTATGAQHRIDSRPAPGCESRNQPSRPVAPLGPTTSGSITWTYPAPVAQVAAGRVSPPKTGDGGLR